MAENEKYDRPLGVYFHWPYCLNKCPYCDFNSHVGSEIDPVRWRDAYLRELEAMATRHDGGHLVSIFFGGGTPSLMPPDLVRDMIAAARSHWPSGQGLEITLEANPTSVEAEKLAAFRDAGVNRVSMGIQALRDDDLKFLGREHSVREALAAFEIAAGIIPRTSFDLIYGRPGQSAENWGRELDEALSVAGSHLSLYQLTIEQGTAFYAQHARGDFLMPEEGLAADLYELTQDRMGAAGLPAYEISNHARPGDECRHNLVYWRYEDYIGVGPGAHGRISSGGQKTATRTHRAPEVWLKKVESDGHALMAEDPISGGDAGLEMLMMGLRLREGVNLKRLAEETGLELGQILREDRLEMLQGEGFLKRENGYLKASPAGLQRLNGVLSALLA